MCPTTTAEWIFTVWCNKSAQCGRSALGILAAGPSEPQCPPARGAPSPTFVAYAAHWSLAKMYGLPALKRKDRAKHYLHISVSNGGAIA
jgi:hypothetical protein